jgi:periplasmic protein TonB
MAFDAFMSQDRIKSQARKLLRVALIVALVFHSGVLSAFGVQSLWHVDELSPPNVAVTFLSGTPPPPPPPPPPKKKKSNPTPKPTQIVQPKANAIVQPKEKEEPEEEDEGEEGGVEGGVAGGVVGAVPVQQETAKFLPPSIGKGQLISDMVNDPRYRPHLPAQLNRAGMVVWGLFKLCVTAQGSVQSVSVLKSADKLVDGEWTNLLKTLQHRPYSIGGRPVPYCYPMRLEVRSQ